MPSARSVPRRWRTPLVSAFAAAAMMVAARPGAQVPPPPSAPPVTQSAPSATPAPATGTGVIMGRVIDGGTNKPIQGAMVGLNAQGAAPASPSAGPAPAAFKPQAVVTGADGFFVFSSLPKGTFVLLTMAPGFNAYISDNQPIPLGDGEKLNDVEVRFFRPGVITGQVRDERGDGVEGVSIRLFQLTSSGGRRLLTSAGGATTDDRGVYRIANLTPGDYGVCALFSRHIAPVAAGMAMAAGSADQRRNLSGSGGLSPAGSGYRIGDLVLISANDALNLDPAPDENGRLSVFADACYPGAPNIQGLETVRVESGQERGQLDMVVRIVPSVRITGTVTGPAARLSGLGVHLYPAAPGEMSIANAIESSQTVTDPDGGFGFVGVPQGSYVLRVVFMEHGRPVEFLRGEPFLFAPISYPQQSGVPPEPTLWASVPITVGDSDVNGLTLALQEGPKITGTVVFDGSKERPQPAQIKMSSIILESTESGWFSTQAPLTAEASFTTSGLVPGRYLVRTSISVSGWSVKSIIANGRDVLDAPLDVGASDINGVVITLTDRPNELSGAVRAAAGQPDRHARVVVFPSDRARWALVTAGRRMQATGVSRQGTFSFSGLPAGDYCVVAMSDQADTDWQNPKVLEALARAATLVTLRDGDKRSVELTTSTVK